MPPGSGHGAYLAAFERFVLPAVQGFEPQLIVVASGFDASGDDPLGPMQCYSETYREMTLMLKSVAQELCEGRLVACHEGGYSPRYVPFCALAIIETLAGIRMEVNDPRGGDISSYGGQSLQPHQEEIIAKAQQMISP